MTLSNDFKAKRQIIMDHYLHPRNSGKIEGAFSQQFFSLSCVDKLTLYVQSNEQKILDIKFTGQGCAIFIASTDLMIEKVKQKKSQEIKDILLNYEKMVDQNGSYDEKMLGNLIVFNHVKSQLNRLECAKMILVALRQIMK